MRFKYEDPTFASKNCGPSSYIPPVANTLANMYKISVYDSLDMFTLQHP